LDAQYEAVNLDTIIPKHLTKNQGSLFRDLLETHKDLFAGRVGTFLGRPPVELTLKPDAKPINLKAYNVPKAHEDIAKREVQRLVDCGVLRRISNSPWGFPSFFIPKKNQQVRIVTDLRRLNAILERHPLPLPKIAELIQYLEGFTWITTLDLNMGYYHIRLSWQAQRICVTILPWGKYVYCRLPMGISTAPNIFQENMSSLFENYDFVCVYIDDLLIITKGSFEDHLEKLHLVFSVLSCNGLQINPHKSKFCAWESEYLGFIISREGIRPLPEKVKAIVELQPPTTRRHLCSFIGMLQQYKDMWRLRAHMLAPLTALTSTKVRFVWTPDHQAAFEKVKEMVASSVLLAYPEFNKIFEIYTDASDSQLGAVITQYNKVIAFYSRKLSPAQRNYSVGDKELLSIVECLRAYRGILLGQRLRIFTDHKNLTFATSTSA
jgi:hypothetical protein